jgi:hypothetical protein
MSQNSPSSHHIRIRIRIKSYTPIIIGNYYDGREIQCQVTMGKLRIKYIP